MNYFNYPVYSKVLTISSVEFTPQADADSKVPYSLLHATTIAAAEEKVREYQPHLIVVEGLENCLYACQHWQIPVLAIVPVPEIDAAMVAGAADCLSPPPHPRLLHRRIQVLLHDQDFMTIHTVRDRLRAGADNLKAVLDALPGVLMILDRNGICLRIASSPKNPLYSPLNRWIGKQLGEIFALDTGTLQQKIEQVVNTQQTQMIEQQALLDGVTHWLQISVSPLDEQDLVAVIHDITDTRQANEALRQSEQRYRDLFSFANDGIMLVDLKTGVIQEANPQAARMLRYGIDELTGLLIGEIELPPDGASDSRSSIGATIQLITETVYRRKNGSLIDVEISIRLLAGKQSAVLIFFRDVTERRRAFQAEKEQRLLAESLREMAVTVSSELDLNRALDALLNHIWRVLPAVRSANIMLVENDVAQIVGARGYERYGLDEERIRSIPIPVNQAPNLQWIYANRRPYIVQNTASTDFAWVNKDLDGHVLSFITAPILLGDAVIGFINLDSPEANAFSNEDSRRLSAFANHAAVAIQNARLYSQIQEYAGDLERRVAQRTLELNQANTLLMEQIRQREEAESQLHAERNLLRAVMDTIPDAIYVKDRQSRFIVVNQATVGRLDEETRRTIQGKSDFDFFPAEFASTLYETEQKVMETGEAIINHSEVFRDSRGQLVHLLVSKLPMRDDHGKVIGIIGVNHNISDLRAAEAALDQVIRSARCLLWSATVMKDDNDEYLWQFSIANESAASAFLPLDTTSHTYSDAWLASIPEQDRKKRDQMLRTHLNFKRHEFSHEFRVQLPDQSVRWLAEDVQVQEISKGRWYLAGVCTEITARKQIEERLQKLNEELELRVANRTHELIRINTALRQEIVERRRAEESERTQRLLAEALRDSVAKVNSTLDLESVFTTLMEVIQAVVPYDSADIMLLEDPLHGRIRHHTGYSTPISTELRDISGWSDKMSAYHSGEAFIIHNTLEFPDYQDSDGLGWVRSNITVPIKLENNIIGFLTLNSKKSNYFTQEQADWLQVFAIQAGIAIRNAHMVQEIRHYTQELENLVEKRTYELQVGQAQLQAILDAMREGVYYGQLNAAPQFINRALVDLTRYTAEEWLDGTAQTAINNHPQTVHNHETTWYDVDTMLSKQGFWRTEAIIPRKDGSVLQIELVRTEVRREDGQREGVVTVMRDISQEKALQEQKARFIAIAAHELRTPIANLKTRLFLLKRQPARFEEHAEVATQVINWMQHLVEDMFDLARFERGIMKLAREEFDIREMVEQIIMYQQPEAERQEIQIDLNMPSVQIYADPYRMMQVFTNLLRNALQYTPQNGKIQIDGRIEDDVLMIQVQDTGKGISEENLPFLFQPFFRASEDNKGAGLGLSITQEIIQAHGGSIAAHSVLGEGSTFSIRLPLEHIRNSGDQ